MYSILIHNNSFPRVNPTKVTFKCDGCGINLAIRSHACATAPQQTLLHPYYTTVLIVRYKFNLLYLLWVYIHPLGALIPKCKIKCLLFMKFEFFVYERKTFLETLQPV